MGKSVLLHNGAALCILLFAATSAQPISVFQILQLIQSAPKSYPAPVYAFSLCMEITNRVFNDSLLNPTTQKYKHMYAEVSGAQNIIFNCSKCHTRNSYRGVKTMKFSKGSVVANCTILFQTIFINNVVVKYLFLTAIDNNFHPNGLEINKDFTKGQRTTTAKRGSGTQPAVLPTFLSSVANPTYKRVPGWAIALMVLACVTLLLILILILLLCCWCFCKKNKKDEATKQSEHTPYERTSFKEHLPAYTSHAPQTNHNFPVIGNPELKKHGNRSGVYVVNPQR
ncbi:putative mucin-1-like [Triplophysa rosa]|uniref:Mucin-1 n=1 Tax=Triplophysa rosa TaxID=992332 RepID=A0A9W7W8F0_TRIRA|nr:putative mucin-1-like [Triplophysa rosa]